MRGIALFAGGVLVGCLLTQTGSAQDGSARSLNHVGMVVADYPKAMDFYTKTMGFKEAYTMRRPDGSPILTYLQLNRDTFVELIPAGPNQQPASRISASNTEASTRPSPVCASGARRWAIRGSRRRGRSSHA